MKLSIATTRQENLLGYIYLVFYHIFLASIISIVAYLLGYPLSLSELNIVYFLVNFLAVVAIFHRFLGRSLQKAWKNIPRCLVSVFIGFGIYYWSTFLLGVFISWIAPDFANVNDQAVEGIAMEYPRIIGFCTVFLIPIVEETLYRGLIFQGLQRKHRILAYIVSTVIFSSIHIIGYIGSANWLTLALCFLQYVPAGIALAWSYERADTIVAPILIHMIVNQIGMSALR